MWPAPHFGSHGLRARKNRSSKCLFFTGVFVFSNPLLCCILVLTWKQKCNGRLFSVCEVDEKQFHIGCYASKLMSMPITTTFAVFESIKIIFHNICFGEIKLNIHNTHLNTAIIWNGIGILKLLLDLRCLENMKFCINQDKILQGQVSGFVFSPSIQSFSFQPLKLLKLIYLKNNLSLKIKNIAHALNTISKYAAPYRNSKFPI